MRVGLTFDLRDEYRRLGYSDEETAEFDSPETIDALETAISDLGHKTDRIGNIYRLTGRLAAGDRWDLVFNIAEGLYGVSRESQVPALLDAHKIPYTFSDPLILALTLHKGLTKRVVREIGIETPDFAAVESPLEIESVRLPFPLFVKPMTGGTSMGISAASKVNTTRELTTTCLALLEKFRQPVLVETFLPGREFTVGILGTGSNARVVGVMEILLLPNAEQWAYSYANKAHYEDRVRYRLADDFEATRAAELAIAVWKGLGCRDAGRVDLRCGENGQAQFIEVNPLAGLRPVHSDLVILCQMRGIEYRQLIEMILDSAKERLASSLVHSQSK